LATDSYDTKDDFQVFDVPERKPSPLLPALGVVSVAIGLMIGVYGFLTQNGSTSSEQYLFGSLGYLLTAVLPIILLQIVWSKHRASVNNNANSPYDLHAGEKQQSFCRRLTLAGLIIAALPIYIFCLPIAEYFA